MQNPGWKSLYSDAGRPLGSLLVQNRYREDLNHSSALLAPQPCRDSLRPAAQTMLAQQPVDVRAHRAMRQAQALRDFLVGEPGGDQREDLGLSRRQPEAAHRRFQPPV